MDLGLITTSINPCFSSVALVLYLLVVMRWSYFSGAVSVALSPVDLGACCAS
jgi:hypothetical protein